LTPIELGGRIKGIEIPNMDKYIIEGKGPYNATLLHLMHAAYSMGLCLFVYGRVDVKMWPEVVQAATGWDYSWEELLEDGARIAAVRQAFNVREEVRVSQIYVAPRSLGHPPLTSGPLAGVSIDLETQKRELYEARGWHPETGKPTEETLTRLGLDDVAQDLY
jgi:aldehyde:ferredoxin oxidoreductase